MWVIWPLRHLLSEWILGCRKIKWHIFKIKNIVYLKTKSYWSSIYYLTFASTSRQITNASHRVWSQKNRENTVQLSILNTVICRIRWSSLELPTKLDCFSLKIFAKWGLSLSCWKYIWPLSKLLVMTSVSNLLSCCKVPHGPQYLALHDVVERS